jgi:hypothetical protein
MQLCCLLGMGLSGCHCQTVSQAHARHLAQWQREADDRQTQARMQLEAWTAAVPQHFPKCISVHLSLPDDSSYMGVSALLPALARQVGCSYRTSTAALVMLSVLQCQ